MRRVATLLLAGIVFSCGNATGSRIYQVHGVVREVVAEYEQVVIEHDDIPGLMPAMTMNFDVADPALLEGLEPGQVVDFELEFTGKAYRILSFERVAAEVTPWEGPSLEDALRVSDPAPAFRLIDHTGAPFALADLRGRAVLLDFIYTQCPGPCPILTGAHVEVLKALPPETRAKSRFVSVSLDPANDTPEALVRYARARGADLDHWSFVTGPVAEVEDVVRRYGIGTLRKPDGEIGHLVVTFLIDPEGNVARRYVGMRTSPEAIARDLARVAETAAPPAAQGEEGS